MKGIPPEIDALMWQLAENGNPVAQAEFEARHTRYGPELTRRIRMVGELRQAGKAVTARPTFTPRPARVVPPSRWAVGAAVGLAVVAVAAVTFVATTSGEKPSVSAPKPQVVHQEPTTPSQAQKPNPVTSPPKDLVTSNEDRQPEEPNPENASDYLKPRDIHLEDASLTAAITLVAEKSGLEVTLAPGFKDRRVSLDYRGQNAIEILREMGEQYGFTIFQESEGHLLAVPARSDETSLRRVGP
jgi:hypothetical protein